MTMTAHRYLAKRCSPNVDRLAEIQDQIDMESYGIRESASGSYRPSEGTGHRNSLSTTRNGCRAIIQELNDRFGAGLTEGFWQTQQPSEGA
jgi:hypothetical protein